MNGNTDVEEPMQGIQPDATGEEDDQQQQLPPAEEALAPQPSMPVRLMYYGAKFNEFNRDANFGPDKQPLHEHQVAISPNVAENLGLKLHDWVWVGPQLRQYADYSYKSPDHPTVNSVEVRDQKVDGHTTLRKATPDEVAANAPKLSQNEMPSAMQASRMTGLDPANITAESVNQVIQGIPQRALAAGEPPLSSYQQALQSDSSTDDTGGAGGAGASDEISQDEAASGSGLTDGAVSGDFATPTTRGMKVTGVDTDGTIHYDGGVTANPKTQIMTWDVGGRRFVKVGPYGKVTSFPSSKIVKDSMGNLYENGQGKMVPIEPAGMIPKLKQGQVTDDMSPEQRTQAALGDLSPDQQNIVKAIAYYKAPLPAAALRNPIMQYAVSRAFALNPNLNLANYDAAKRMIIGYAQGKQGTEGGQIRSLNQTVMHLGVMDDLAKAMQNTWNPKYNSVKNWLQTNAGKPYQKAYDDAAFQVANEMARALKGSAPDQADIQKQESFFSDANSPEQFNQLIHKTVPSLLGGALEAMDSQYEGVMGEQLPEKRLIYPQVKDTLLKMGVKNFAGRQLGEPGPEADPMYESAAVELQRQGRLVTPDTIKEAMRRMKAAASPSPSPPP